ncbi:hypothetical protein VP01_5668g1, partial [Puccinia sorghi]
KEKQLNANLNLSQIANLPSFICWADQSCKNIIYIVISISYQNPNQSNGPSYSGKMYSLGWRKGYEEASKIGITGIAAKVAKDPDGYCKLQSHVPEQNTFIGEHFYLVYGPLFDEVKKQHNALKAPGLEPKFKEDPDVLLSIYPSLSPNFPANHTKMIMPHPSHFSCAQLNRTLDSMELKSVPGKPLHILT